MSESEPLAVVESYADRIRRNDESLTKVGIAHEDIGVGSAHEHDHDIAEMFDALKYNTVAKKLYFSTYGSLDVQMIQEALDKLSEVMKCNKSVELFNIDLQRGLLVERLFATMAASGGWSSIQELQLDDGDTTIEPLGLEHISTFILQSENLRTLKLEIRGDEAAPIVDTLSRTNTKVQSLKIGLDETFSLQNGGRQLATALGRCTFITQLRLDVRPGVDLEFFQILLVESIPTMLGLKKLEIATWHRGDL
jgi:hypothetical protein